MRTPWYKAAKNDAQAKKISYLPVMTTEASTENRRCWWLQIIQGASTNGYGGLYLYSEHRSARPCLPPEPPRRLRQRMMCAPTAATALNPGCFRSFNRKKGKGLLKILLKWTIHSTGAEKAKHCRTNAPNMEDNMALHSAALHDRVNYVNLLLENKADRNTLNKHGKTPLHHGCFWGYQEITEVLLIHDVQANVANVGNDSPIDKRHRSPVARPTEVALMAKQIWAAKCITMVWAVTLKTQSCTRRGRFVQTSWHYFKAACCRDKQISSQTSVKDWI